VFLGALEFGGNGRSVIISDGIIFTSKVLCKGRIRIGGYTLIALALYNIFAIQKTTKIVYVFH
jgi:hypothetical protein